MSDRNVYTYEEIGTDTNSETKRHRQVNIESGTENIDKRETYREILVGIKSEC